MANAGGRMLDKMGILGKGLKLGAKGIGGAAKGAWWLTKNTAKLGWGAAKFGGRMLGSQALRTGAMFAGRMALGAILGAAGLVSAPVLVAAAVIGGVILVGGLIYKLAKDELPPLTRLRMAQYGVKPEPDSKQVQQILQIEKLFAQGTSVDSENKAKLDSNSIPLEKIAEILQIDMNVPKEENDAMRRLAEYMKGRFSAVYLVHVSNYFALTKSLDLKAVDDKVTGKAALEFLSKVAMKDQSIVFDAMVGPFEDDELDMDSGDVEDVFDDAKSLIEKSIRDTVQADNISEKKAAHAVTAAAAATAATGIPRMSEAVAGNKAAASGGGGSTPFANAGAGKTTLDSVAGSMKTTAAVTGGSLLMVSAAASMQGRSTELDDGKSVRYRVYGLTEMAESKVGHLSQLESYCFQNVKYDGDGQALLSDETAAHQMAEKIFSPIGEEAENVYVWFYRRFLPTFLTYCSEVRARANIDAADAARRMKPADFLDVLRATATATDNAGIPVWGIDNSPWKGYYMNDEPKSVEDALYSLSLKIKDKTVTEVKAANKGRSRGPDGEFKDEDPTQTNKPASASNDSSGRGQNGAQGDKADEGGFLQNMWDSTKSFFGGGDSKKPQSDSMPSGGGGPATGPTSISGGQPVNHPGGGSGGNINDIPQPTGKDWDSNKATIIAAANMVGVDPLLASSIAGVESGYNPTARPWSKKEQRFLSSAAGYFQVINDTWKELMGKYGAKYGIDPNATQMDPRANALLGLEYIRENTDKIGSVMTRGVTDTDVYMAHFLGTGGAKRFLKAPQGDRAIDHVDPAQADANKTIFYDSKGSPRTVAAVWADFDAKLKKHRKPEATQIAASSVGGSIHATPAISTETPPEVAAATTSETPSMVKPADAPSTTSANTVAEASTPTVDPGLATKADERQVGNTTSTLAVSAQVAEAQSSNQAKASADTYGGMEKGMGKLIGVNEAQLEQLIKLVELMASGEMKLPNAAAPAANLSASTATTQNPNANTKVQAKPSTVSVARV
jgi:hypothetical protein